MKGKGREGPTKRRQWYSSCQFLDDFTMIENEMIGYYASYYYVVCGTKGIDGVCCIFLDTTNLTAKLVENACDFLKILLDYICMRIIDMAASIALTYFRYVYKGDTSGVRYSRVPVVT